jgi:alpha-tubulin suppressor-like RCC1 family protein
MSNKQTIIDSNINDIIQIASSVMYCLLLKENGQIYGLGYNYHGQLGMITSTKTFQQSFQD